VTLGDLAKHSEALAQAVVAAGTIPVLVPYLYSSDPNCHPILKQQVCYTLAHIAKHSVALAKEVVASQIFPIVLFLLKDRDPIVRRLAAGLVREIVKHTQELAQLAMRNGGAAALVVYLKPESQNEPLNGVMAVGHIASFSQSLALALMAEYAAAVVLNVFVAAQNYRPKDARVYQTITATVWAVGQLGKHSPEHALKLTNLNALPLFVNAHNDPDAPDDMIQKTEAALKHLILKCTDLDALRPLITPAQGLVKLYIVQQIAKLLPLNPKWRKPFFAAGGLRDLQRIQPEKGSEMDEYIARINACYPPAVVEYYNPEYPQKITESLERMD
jgi:hypothetical protein